MRFVIAAVILAGVALWCSVAFAVGVPLPPAPEESIFSLVRLLIDTAKSGQWQMFAAVAIMALTWGVRKVLAKKWDDEDLKPYTPWIAAALGMGMAFAAATLAGMALVPALLAGFVTGAAAVGFWEMVVEKGAKKLPGLFAFLVEKVRGLFNKLRA